jgi:glyoxylase-like metal-dependent hydrolase (beta-lactamase superfamily II)
MPTIGPYTLHVIETGRLGLDGGAMFGIVPKPLWERRIPADAQNRIPLHMRCLLLEAADRLVLIDDGLGDKYDDKFARIYAVDHERAELHRSLEAAGFGAADVTDVVLTHLHFDHCGGSTRRKGGRLVPAFPEARFHVQRAHWEWARHPNAREKGSFFKENLDPLAASGQLQLLDGPGTLFPGVEVRVVNGHTEAQQIVKVEGPEGTLVFAADLLPTTAHLAPAWNMAYDVRPLVTIEEKGAFLEEAAAAGWHLFFEHDPEVAVASLIRSERGIETTDHRSLAALWS